MQRHGRSATGRQRWLCPRCRRSAVVLRPDRRRARQHRLFLDWLLTGRPQTTLAIPARTLRRWFTPFWHTPPVAIPPTDLKAEILILDAVYLAGRTNAVLIGRTITRVVFWLFAERESYLSWASFCQSLPAPWAVVCDGHHGLLKAITERYPDAKIQRCLIHLLRLGQIRLTRRPTTRAGQAALALFYRLMTVRTRRQKRRWLRAYRQWEKHYAALLMERTVGDRRTPTGRRAWWYTHRSVRAARSLIRNALPNLFTFVRYPQIPRTTNHVEGGLNARLKELIHRHRGLDQHKKQALAAYFLASKS